MRMLFITQKIHQDDDDLAFVILWIKEFIAQGVPVEVICLERGNFDDSFPVHSLGKEKGYGKIRQVFLFYKYLFSIQHDRVFVHMNPEYFTLAGWFWFLRQIPMYLWYTHYNMYFHMWIAGKLSTRMFAATKQSLPQYEGDPRKIITGHGIDVPFWIDESKNSKKIETNTNSEFDLFTVHRICRSKRLEIVIEALLHLPEKYTLTVYGRDVEKDYYKELQDLVKEKKLESRVTFMGPVPMHELRNIYGKYRVMVNMASETIDKTMLEGMLFGLYPVTTEGNTEAIGLPIAPEDDESKTVAEFIEKGEWKAYDTQYLQTIVKEKHGLRSLISKMNTYVKEGR